MKDHRTEEWLRRWKHGDSIYTLADEECLQPSLIFAAIQERYPMSTLEIRSAEVLDEIWYLQRRMASLEQRFQVSQA
jgi:hypothetical protein